VGSDTERVRAGDSHFLWYLDAIKTPDMRRNPMAGMTRGLYNRGGERECIG
jgi:hypothetical protein